MFHNAQNAIRAYANTEAAGAMAASPHRLVEMLFEGAQIAVAAARTHVQLGRVQQKCESIAKAIAIIDDGLRASLDMNSGGELAERLASLYDYMVLRLTQANTGAETEPLDEVGLLLTELAGAWRSITKGEQRVASVTGA